MVCQPLLRVARDLRANAILYRFFLLVEAGWFVGRMVDVRGLSLLLVVHPHQFVVNLCAVRIGTHSNSSFLHHPLFHPPEKLLLRSNYLYQSLHPFYIRDIFIRRRRRVSCGFRCPPDKSAPSSWKKKSSCRRSPQLYSIRHQTDTFSVPERAHSGHTHHANRETHPLSDQRTHTLQRASAPCVCVCVCVRSSCTSVCVFVLILSWQFKGGCARVFTKEK